MNPGDSVDGGTLFLQQSQQFSLTCAYSVTTAVLTEIEWIRDQGRVLFTGDAASDGSISASLNGTVTTSVFSVTTAPGNYTGEYYCRVNDTVSSALKVLTTEYTVVVGSTARCGVVGDEATLTCTAANPATLTTPPTVSWYKVGQTASIADTSDYEVTSEIDGTTVVSNLKLVLLVVGDVYDGVFYCTAEYTDTNSVLITSEDKTSFNVVGFNTIPVQYATVGATSLTFATEFYGTEPSGASWKYLGVEISSNITNSATASSTGASFSLTLDSIAEDSISRYEAVVGLDTCSADLGATLQTSAVLEILSANVTASDNGVVLIGGSVGITCMFSLPSTLATSPQATWALNGEGYGGYLDSSSSGVSPVASQTLSIVTADKTAKGTYTCSVKYDKGTLEPSVNVTVVDVYDIADQYVVTGTPVTITCVVYGYEATIKWLKADDSVVTGTTDAIDSETDEMEARIEFGSVAVSDETEYSCVAAWSIATFTKTVNSHLYVMRLISITPTIVSEGSSAELTCLTSWPLASMTNTPTVTWTKTDADGASETLTASSSDPLKLTVQAGTVDEMQGVYKCSVDFNGVVREISETVSARASATIELEIEEPGTNSEGNTVLLGIPVTLISTFLGDSLSVPAWTKDGSPATSTELYSISTSTTTYSTQSNLTILATFDGASAGLYRCQATYDSGKL